MSITLHENKYFIFDQTKTFGIKYIIKKILSFIGRIFYSLVFGVIHLKREKETKYNVSICAIFKDEADYLKEWIEFHRIIGIEHFYLYNNISSDNYMDVLSSYIKLGIVTLVDWTDKPGQMSSYSHCVKMYKDETKWIAFIDIDEFIIPNVTNTIYDFLKKFERYPIVIAYWRCFGTSGKIYRETTGLVTEDFFVSMKKYTDIGKCFYNTLFSFADKERININNVHNRWSKYGNLLLPPVNCFRKICLFGENPIKKSDIPLQINHYLLKSYKEYNEKKSKRGGGVHDVGMHNMSYFIEHESKCQGVDFHAYKYLIQLKLNLKNRKSL